MPPITITTPAVGDPTRRPLALAIKNAIDYLNGQVGQVGQDISSLGLPNGSFEIGSAANTAPSAWSISIGAGNSSAFETADPAHGKQAFSMTNPGGATGGVVLTSLDFIYCGQYGPFILGWYMKTTVATTTNAVKIRWYDETESLISTSTLYNASTGNPTSWAKYHVEVTPPATARLFKIVIEGVNSTTAGTTYWDGFGISLPAAKGMSFHLTAGAGTHTTGPLTTRVKVTMRGGGGGGGGGGSGSTGGDGTGGEDTWFGDSAKKALGGNGGIGGPSSASSAAGGIQRAGSVVTGSGYAIFIGRSGGGNLGSGSAGASVGGAAMGNGYGRGGRGGDGQNNTRTGGGGGAPGGDSVLWMEVLPNTEYDIYIGSGGAGGSSVVMAGDNGDSGFLYVEEF